MTTVAHLNPARLHPNPAFTHAVKITQPASLVFIGGQNGVDAAGEIVGDDAAAQAEQALRNVITAVEAAGGTLTDIFKWTILVTDPPRSVPGSAPSALCGGSAPTRRRLPSESSPAWPTRYLVEVEAVAAI